MKFDLIDLVVFTLYCLIVIGIGLWVSRTKKGERKDSTDYFLASKSLPWWAVGASIIAANISAEQFIGMSGSGFAIGMGIATYEFIASIGLVLVAVFFLPIYIRSKVYTMPQFLEQRYDKRVKTVMAIFWLAVFVFVNLTSILYLGALAVRNMMGVDLVWGMIGLALFAVVYSVYGGLKAVAWTDVIQVVFLLAGGLITTYVAFELLGDGSVITGIDRMWSAVGTSSADNRFDMVLEPEHPFYKDLPGLGVLIGGLWVANLYYWGCNQYIIQRALAAKSLAEAQKGLVFAGFLKLILPIIVVVPGIIAYLLYTQGKIDGITVADDAYPILLSQVPAGIRGLAFAALIAAIVSSLASMMNSISTIFTMDIYKTMLRPKSSERNLVSVGRWTSVVVLAIACVIAPALSSLDQAFQFIQEFTGFVSPGALAIFLAGFFFKRATANGALAAAMATFVFSGLLRWLVPEMPFIDRMGIVFLCSLGLLVLVSLFDKRHQDPQKAIPVDRALFHTTTEFKVWALMIVIVLVAIYTLWW